MSAIAQCVLAVNALGTCHGVSAGCLVCLLWMCSSVWLCKCAVTNQNVTLKLANAVRLCVCVCVCWWTRVRKICILHAVSVFACCGVLVRWSVGRVCLAAGGWCGNAVKFYRLLKMSALLNICWKVESSGLPLLLNWWCGPYITSLGRLTNS